MRGLKRAVMAAILTGMAFGSCFPSCCDLSLPDLPNLGECLQLDSCGLLALLLGGVAG